MRAFITWLLITPILIVSCCSARLAESVDNIEPQQPASANVTRQPVLVELFTSEGCSSCPPADKALAFLETNQPVAGAEIITLAFHVDYWDSSSWKDRFSSPLFSQRQGDYAEHFHLDSSYTPQMVVDGESEFVGSNSSTATDALTKAALRPKPAVEIVSNSENVSVTIQKLPKHENATVYLAAAEDSIATDVKGGENRGTRLQHISVVREFRSIGTADTSSETFKTTAPITINPDWNRENLKFVVFVQENSSRKIIAVGKSRYVPS